MNRHFARPLAVTALALTLVAGGAAPALADHTKADKELSSTSSGAPGVGQATGKATWKHIRNFPANPGTDFDLFTHNGELFASMGTLGQASIQHVGQRFLRLVGADGKVAPTWVADHGSAACGTANPSGTLGLQHDVQVTPRPDAELAIDTTDATGRCHDPVGGGLEIIDIMGIGRAGGAASVKEIHLTRHDGTSHNVTVDDKRPWILYNSNADADRPWIDVLDIRTCLGLAGKTLDEKRAACSPKVFRIPFEPTWTAKSEGGKLSVPYGCHDITSVGTRLYCAAINGTAIFDVAGLTDAAGNVKGTPLPCKVIPGTGTAAKVTDCDLAPTNGTAALDAAAYKDLGSPRAEGWTFLGSINHPGIQAGNNQVAVRADEGVSISHEAEPTPDGRFMFVTDERGGGVLPPGATCPGPGPANPVGNGGMHVFDIRNPAKPEYALGKDGKKAIFISKNVTPQLTFCNIHLIEHIPGEQRLVMSWYSQGIKVVDYAIDDQGRFSFEEVASYTMPLADTWTVEQFKIESNADNTRTYYLLTNDIVRGIDVLSFTLAPNLLPATASPSASPSATQPRAAPSSGASTRRPAPTKQRLPATGDAPWGLYAAAIAVPAAFIARRLSRRRQAA